MELRALQKFKCNISTKIYLNKMLFVENDTQKYALQTNLFSPTIFSILFY